MKLIVSNIDWDTSGDDSLEPVDLPSTVTIDDPMLLPHLMENVDGEAENLAEWLTQKYGYCLRGFTTAFKGEAGS